MTKALFKKQMMEVFSWLYKDKKSGKLRTVKGLAVYVLLYLIIFGILGTGFYFMATMLCEPLVTMGMGWLYWCLMGLISIFLGVFGSVFNTYASLYQANDNDLLLAMPVPASHILLVRLSGVYIMGFIYELITMIPALIVWFIHAPFRAVGTVCVVLFPFVLSVFILVLSAILGWVVALIAGKLKHKNIVVVIASLVFIAGYYYLWGQAYSMLQALLLNAEMIGSKMKTALYPLYHMGLAAEGKLLSMLIFTAIIGGLFVIVYAALSRSFLKLATTNHGAAKAVYKEQKIKPRSVGSTLLQKELRRFIGSSNYMLNCGLGIILMPVGAIALVWKADLVREMIAGLPVEQAVLYLGTVGVICLLANMNNITAPSVSLEGKNLWLVQVCPVSGRQVLMAKLKLHLLLTLIPAGILTVAAGWVLKPGTAFAILIPLAVLLFVLFMASMGLLIGLKMPNLDWTSEVVPIKQSLGVMLVLFGGWAVIVVFAGLYFLLGSILNPLAYLALICIVLLAGCSVLLRWLMTKGAEIFEAL